jgi:hypothetical protein
MENNFAGLCLVRRRYRKRIITGCVLPRIPPPPQGRVGQIAPLGLPSLHFLGRGLRQPHDAMTCEHPSPRRNTMTIKPIETQYNGYKFRSRLEARWAVFFEKAGFDWEYEPEGFDLDDGIWYLPDFVIFNLGNNPVYIEIKPSNIKDEDERVCKFCKETEQSIIYCLGLPDGWAVLYEPNGNVFQRHVINWRKLPNYYRALIAAKSARFERGQSP